MLVPGEGTVQDPLDVSFFKQLGNLVMFTFFFPVNRHFFKACFTFRMRKAF